VTPVDTETGVHSYAILFFNRNLEQAAHVSTTLRQLSIANPTGYFVEDLWTNDKLGLMMPDDTFTATVNPTGVVMLKATLAQTFEPDDDIKKSDNSNVEVFVKV